MVRSACSSHEQQLTVVPGSFELQAQTLQRLSESRVFACYTGRACRPESPVRSGHMQERSVYSCQGTDAHVQVQHACSLADCSLWCITLRMNADDPYWMDALVDVLLGQLSQQLSHPLPLLPLREACEAAFRAFAELLTPTGQPNPAAVAPRRNCSPISSIGVWQGDPGATMLCTP